MMRWTALAVIFTGLSVASLVVWAITLVGWVGGDRLAAPAVVLGGCLGFAGFFAFAAWKESDDDRRGDAQPPGAPVPRPEHGTIAMTVRHRLGAVFWLHTAVSAACFYYAGWTLVRWFTHRAEMSAEFDATGRAGFGTSWVVACSISLVGGLLAILPRRIWRARARSPLWLSDRGIGFNPEFAFDFDVDFATGFIPWSEVTEVGYSGEEISMTLIVFRHHWVVTVKSDIPRRSVTYPLGAVPRPRRIRREIRRLAPATRVRGSW